MSSSDSYVMPERSACMVDSCTSERLSEDILCAGCRHGDEETEAPAMPESSPKETNVIESTAVRVLHAGIGHMVSRAGTYDKPEGERSMEATFKAFQAITGDGLVNTEERGWLFMILLKAVRCQSGNFKLDNYEDGAAYFGLMAEAAEKERIRTSQPSE